MTNQETQGTTDTDNSASVHPFVVPRFKVGDRVRVKFGIDRGKYAFVSSQGGDDRTYYGIIFDGETSDAVGYCDYELEAG